MNTKCCQTEKCIFLLPDFAILLHITTSTTSTLSVYSFSTSFARHEVHRHRCGIGIISTAIHSLVDCVLSHQPLHAPHISPFSLTATKTDQMGTRTTGVECQFTILGDSKWLHSIKCRRCLLLSPPNGISQVAEPNAQANDLIT